MIPGVNSVRWEREPHLATLTAEREPHLAGLLAERDPVVSGHRRTVDTMTRSTYRWVAPTLYPEAAAAIAVPPAAAGHDTYDVVLSWRNVYASLTVDTVLEPGQIKAARAYAKHALACSAWLDAYHLHRRP